MGEVIDDRISGWTFAAWIDKWIDEWKDRVNDT